MYILLCSDNSFYIGSSKDIYARLDQHQAGEGGSHTRKRRPVKLVYFEEFEKITDAFYREKQVQKYSRAKKQALVNRDKEAFKKASRGQSERERRDKNNS